MTDYAFRIGYMVAIKYLWKITGAGRHRASDATERKPQGPGS